jgi:hypothetical protein
VNRFTVSTQIRHFVMAITVMDSASFGDLLLGLVKLISVVVVALPRSSSPHQTSRLGARRPWGSRAATARVEEGEQRFPILRQAGDRLLVLGAVFVGEHVIAASAAARVGAP